jgi:hypothetical protein
LVSCFDRSNSGHSLERLLTIFRNGPGNNAEAIEDLIDLHAVGAQHGSDIADPGEVLVIHRYADADHVHRVRPDGIGAACLLLRGQDKAGADIVRRQRQSAGLLCQCGPQIAG